MAKRLITVSQLKCACLDADWRARWLRGEQPPTFLFGKETGRVPVQGTLFHQLAEAFTSWLITAPKKEGNALSDAEALWDQLYERFAKVRLDELIAAGKLPSAHHLSQALRAFCQQLAVLRSRCPGFRTWQDVYFTREFQLEAVRFHVPGGELFVSGRPDAVRSHPEHGVEVVDYKLSRGGNLKHDLLQLALYARLLRETKPGLKFSGVLEFYEPALHELAVGTAELEAIFNEVAQPVIAELAGAPEPVRNTSQPAQAQDQRWGDPYVELIEKCYADFKLSVKIAGRQEAPQLIRYRAQPASGVKVVSLQNRSDDLQVALRIRQPPLIQAAPGCVTIDIPKEQPDVVLWRDLRREEAPLSFPIGVGIDNEIIGADLAEPAMCHALVAGTSGSGKSEFLKCLVASLISRHPPGRLRLSIVDPKILTFGALQHCSHLLEPVITDLPAAIACLKSAVAEMDARYQRLAREGFENLTQRGADAEMPFRVLIFDEFGDLVLAGKREREEFESLVARIAQKGRAAGIHLVLTTQRPDARIVTGLIKSNLPLKICLRVVNSTNSSIVLDQTGAERLLGRGDLLCDRGRGLERAQSPFISQEELRALSAAGVRG